MPPRIANDCFPDELLTVDYDPTMGMGMGILPGGGAAAAATAPMPMGMGGGGFGAGTAGTENGVGQPNNDMDVGDDDNDDNEDGATAAVAAAAAVAIAEEELESMTTTATAAGRAGGAVGLGGNDFLSNSIENDPLSMLGQSTTTTTVVGIGGIGQSHSSGSDHVMFDRYAVALPTNIVAADAMATTVTVSMAAAAQQAWDQFVVAPGGQQQPYQHLPQQQQQGSPSSIPQLTSPSTASLVAQYLGTPPPPLPSGVIDSTTTPFTYQQHILLQQQQQQQQQQHRQDIGHANATSTTPVTYQQMASQQQQQHHHHRQDSSMNASSSNASVTSMTSRMALAQHHHQQLQQQHFLRASRFGGFSAPSRGPATRSYDVAGLISEQQQHQGGVGVMGIVSTPPVATVSRSNSVASSLTTSLPNSVRSSSTNTTSYHGFLTSLQHQNLSLPNSPLDMIPFSDGDEDNSPQETYGSIHSTSEHSASLFGSSRSSPNNNSKLSPGEETNSTAASPHSAGVLGGDVHSPKLPYSPSLLDKTSFPEEEDLSIEDDCNEDDNGSEHSPISKLNWGIDAEGENKGLHSSAAADTTVDNTMNDYSVDASRLLQGIASHVIHEDLALTDVTTPRTILTASSLRPRVSPYASVVSSSGVIATNNNESIVAGSSGIPATVRPQYRYQISDVSIASQDGSVQLHVQPTPPLSFGPDTSISDLTYYAEKGCIVDVLAALTDPHLKTLGTRMLADYAKMPHRRVAVASNARILEFVQSTALEIGSYSSFDHVSKYTSPAWLGREYAVETVRSLTAAEENDQYLMNSPGMLQMLALIARGGPFVQLRAPNSSSTSGQGCGNMISDPIAIAVPPPSYQDNGTPGPRLMVDNTMGVASDRARLHACIAIMNLSCGKSNKIEITAVTDILEGMRDVMLGRHFATQPHNSLSSTRAATTLADEARLKATTCIKNLSNADANDAALLGTSGLVETLGYVAEATCHPKTGATICTTHACLALMNLSISKANKNRVFRTPGVMDALMAVITRTAPKADAALEGNTLKDPNVEARVKACSALSNLAIGYDNKIPMLNYPGFVESILTVIKTDKADARTKACSILWSFAAEMKNQVPVVKRGDILPTLVSVAKEDTKTEARFKCVAALTLLAESPENAVPLLKAGSLEPLMNILHEAGPDPTQWRGQTASWCVGFLMNMAQCDDVVAALLQEGIVDLLAPLLSLDHYQSLKAAMAVTFVCQYDTGDKTYNLLRQTENVIPKIVGLLHNTLSGRGGSGYKYGVFTLRSSVGCIASLAAGPDFMKEKIATNPVFESLLKVVEDFCVDGGTPGAIVGGGKDDTRSVTLAVRALSSLIGHLIHEPNCAAMPFGPVMDDQLITALRSFELSPHPDIDETTRKLAYSARIRVEGGKNLHGHHRTNSMSSESSPEDMSDDGGGIGLSLARRFFPFPCGMNLHVPSDPTPGPATSLTPKTEDTMDVSDDANSDPSADTYAVRTFLLTDSMTGRRFAVPSEPSGGRQFNDNRVWCFRRGRYCNEGEVPDSNFAWSDDLQCAYETALANNTIET